MAPVKRGSADALVAAKGPASQRSISSFFGSKPVPSKKKSPRKAAQETARVSPDCGRDRPKSSLLERSHGDGGGGGAENQCGDELDCSPVSSRSNGAEKGGGGSTKSKNWISTPSPSEPAKPVTKTFGRRDRKSLTSGVVAPVSTSTDPPPEKAFSPESAVGKRLKVYWPLDRDWYTGRVKSYNKADGSHKIKYDDGEEESIVLAEEKVKWEDEDTGVLRNSTKKRTPRVSTREDSPPLTKRKKMESDDENDDSLLNELRKDDEDEVQSRRFDRRKRPHLYSWAEDSPAKGATICTNVYEDAEIAFCEESEGVTVRRRLRKAAKRGAPERKNDISGMDDEGSEGEKRPPKRAGSSVRRLALDEAVDQSKNQQSTKSGGRPSSGPCADTSSRVSIDPDCTKLLPRKTKPIGPDALAKTPVLSKNSQAKDFFSKLNGRPSKGASGVATPSAEKPTSPAEKDITEIPPVHQADERTKGELHSTLVGDAAERFGGRVEEKFKFLGKGRRDGAGRRPSDPDYDPRTVLLPQDFLKGLSGGQRQWWEFKSKHMDKVLFFKMGKFYEMFEMDAHIGAQELDLQYMKGDQPHCGFPEKLYSESAEKLAHKGYRVLVVEQTETPDQLEQRRKDTGAKDKVVRREVCAVLTKGTIVDGEMLLTHPDAAYLMSITEMPLPSEEPSVTPDHAVSIGVCFVDTSTSHIMLGQFIDDLARSRLCSVLSELRPVEVIKPRGILSGATERAIKDHTRQPLINALIPGREFWDARQSLEEILKVYIVCKNKMKPNSGKSSRSTAADRFSDQLHLLPRTLREMADAGSRGEAALSAIGGCLFYLREALLDQTVLTLGRIDLLPGSDPISRVYPVGVVSENDSSLHSEGGDSERNASVGREQLEPYMTMDSAALENLEIIENNRDGGHSGTLFAHLDNCVTPYGRRMLKQWLVRPLLRVEPILQRQEAIVDLKGVAAEAALQFRAELKGQADMERVLARLHACSGASGRNGENVVLYEDAAKKQLQEFMCALRGCRALLQAGKKFETCSSKLASDRLRKLVTPGLVVPDMTPAIEHFEAAFDRREAEKTGRIIPHEGVDEDFDEGDSMVKTASQKLAEYLFKQRKKFNNSSEINYVTVGKEAYQMEIPEAFHAKVPSSYEMRSSRKGFQRYWTPQIRELLQELTAGEQQRETALRGILQGFVKRFCQDCSKWLALVKSVAEVDVLISLSEASVHSGPTCRPTLKERSSSGGPEIFAKEIRHPTVGDNLARGGAFVPNDVALGGTEPPFMLLTGPNMGGKSTLIRQVCLAVVMAQIGANVTAAQFELSPVDRVFVRMGAKDHIMAGQSTFLVELSETAFMLRSATARSLVALDELGRGTSTSDGQAIAHSVLQHLAHNVGCRGMFSTHYHRLAAHFASDPKVGLRHMSCKVGTGVDGLEDVIFLYKLCDGACPKSYGVNVARLAGMPESVLSRAASRASELERLWGSTADARLRGEPQAVSVRAEDEEVEEDDVIGSEKDIRVVKEVVGLLKKIPDNAAGETLLQLWQEAKRIWQNNCGERYLDAEQELKESAQRSVVVS